MNARERETKIDKGSVKETKKEASHSRAQLRGPPAQNPSCCGSNKVAMATALAPPTCVRRCMLENQSELSVLPASWDPEQVS